MTWIKAHMLECYLALAVLWAGYFAYNLWQVSNGEHRLFPLVCSGVALACSIFLVTLFARERSKKTIK